MDDLALRMKPRISNREKKSITDTISLHSLKQIAVRTGAFEAHVVAFEGVDQHPIRLNVAIAAAAPGSTQRMVTELWRQGRAVNHQIKHSFEFRQILASMIGQLHVLLEL
jgi:hypothetical protein